MDSSLIGLILGAIAAFLVFKFVKGVIKFVVLALIVLAVLYFLTQGAL